MNFSAKIARWYEQNKRALPWRETSDPYRIWLSEIMLQQTRIDQGLSYYLRFTEAFPDIHSLASASEDRVLKLWQGLGYYSRARNLHRTAKLVATELEGKFPGTYEELIKLPGIGEYTAAAILSISFIKPYPVVDGNVYRVLTRLFGIDAPIDSGKGKKLLASLAADLLDHQQPGNHNQAVMEFGALHCKPQAPDCPGCIFNRECIAFSKGEVEKFPVRKTKQAKRLRYFYYFLIRFRGNHSDKILINKRRGEDIWKNLYDFPLLETGKRTSLNKIREIGLHGLDLKKKDLNPMGNEYKHILSHQVIQARFISLDLPAEALAEVQKDLRIDHLVPVETKDLVHFPVPRLIEKFLERNRLTESS